MNVTASGGIGSEVVMHTVTVPADEAWLIALTGTLTPYFKTNTNGPVLQVGDVLMGPRLHAGDNGVAAIQTGTVEIKIKRNSATGTDSFDGFVYAVKI